MGVAANTTQHPAAMIANLAHHLLRMRTRGCTTNQRDLSLCSETSYHYMYVCLNPLQRVAECPGQKWFLPKPTQQTTLT